MKNKRKSIFIDNVDEDIKKAKKCVDKQIINSISKLKDIIDVNFYSDFNNPIEYADKYQRCGF